MSGALVRFTKFEIRNFKGIKETILSFPESPTSVTTLVGLNESGKTTILEALDEFSLCLNSDSLKQMIPKDKANSKNAIIPKSRLGNFSDKISIKGHLSLSKMEVKEVEAYINEKHDGVFRLVTLSDGTCEFTISRELTFENSEHIATNNMWTKVVRYKKSNKHKKYELIENTGLQKDAWSDFTVYVKDKFLPSIIYYPIFYFDFPERIYLSKAPDESRQQKFYRGILQQILSAHPEKYDLKKHVVDRIVVDGKLNPKLQTDQYLPQMIQKVMTAMETVVTSLVFESWNQIFGNSLKNRDMKILYSYEQKENKCYPYIRFEILQDGDLYPIADRSLGFRWFFCFLLFTVFKENSPAGTVFLIDEPASSLHATAQAKLLEKFRLICGEQNSILYTTHSHHMINPNWLESCYIVSNEAIDHANLTAFSVKPTEIIAHKVKSFLAQSQDRPTYYQPILEKLQYKKSGIELGASATLLEGKTDFYVLSYFRDVYFKEKYGDLNFVPGTGCGSLSTLISLHSGWGVDFLVFLDNDNDGKDSRAVYKADHFLSENKFIGYDNIFPEENYTEIESLFTQNDIIMIKDGQGKKLKKSIPFFFPLLHFKKSKAEFEEKTINNFEKVLSFIETRINSI